MPPDLALSALILVALAFVAGGAVKGGFGFGLPLVTVPLLATVMPPPTAISLMLVPVIAANIVQAFQGGYYKSALRRFWRRIVPGLDRKEDPWTRPVRVRIEFYRRLEAVLGRFGLVRSATQTQREFARHAESVLLESTGEPHLASLPGVVVEAFYCVRFGGSALDKPQAQAVEKALVELADAAVDR